MKSHRRSLVQIILLTLFVSALVLAFAPSVQVQQSAKVSTTTRGGLRTVTFDTSQGKVIVNLPDNMMAGDTISGTVIVEPKGQQSEGRSLSMELLFDFSPPIKVPTSGGSREAFTIKIPPGTKNDKGTDQMKLALKGKGGEYYSTNYPLTRSSGSSTAGQPAGTANDRGFPDMHIVMGQQGRPIQIPGPFDGSVQNTKVTVGGQEVPILTESPGGLVFESPANITGPTEVVLTEAGKQTKGEYRNVGVNLSAPKTTLEKGESTTLTVQVSGLQGITESVPLHLVKGGVVSMQGGDAQTMSIKPADVQPDGTFTTTRTITGVQAGAWSSTATVVIFDICLQDDNNGNTLIFSSETGDYIFCRKRPLGNAVPTSGETPNSDFSGGVSVSAGDILDLTKNGTFTSADFKFKAGHIHAEIDSQTHSGTATVQRSNPKQTFTIRDRDTRNNTCSCPGLGGVQAGEPAASPSPGNEASKPGVQAEPAPSPAPQTEATPGATPSPQPSPATSPQPLPTTSPQPSPATSPQPAASPTPQPGEMADEGCASQTTEAERLKEEITKKEKELAGVSEEKAKTAKEIEKCKNDTGAKDAAEKARKDLEKKKSLLDSAKRNGDSRAAGYEKDYNEAKKAKEAADQKVVDDEKKCKDLEQKLIDLGKKEKSLPGEIEDLKKKLEDAEKKLSEWKAAQEKKKKDEEERKREAEEDKRRTEAEKAKADADSEAASAEIKYLLDNIKRLNLISSSAFWDSEPEKNNHLIEALKKSARDLGEHRLENPVPVEAIEAVKELAGLVAILLNPCTAGGMQKTHDRLIKMNNPKTNRNYTSTEAQDKTERMCELLQKLKALAGGK